jgi:hypothetical protein
MATAKIGKKTTGYLGLILFNADPHPTPPDALT